MTELRRVIQDHWVALAAAAVPTYRGRFAVTDIAVRTPHGAVSAAVDADGRRHLLLPLAPGQTLEPDTRSSGVHLVLRELGDPPTVRRYADLVLNDARLSDVFTSLCSDVIAAVAGAVEDAVRVTKDVLSAWRSLLDAARPRLGPGGAAGLFGELNVLDRVLSLDAGAVGVWTGPFGTAHDFHRLAASVEVKTTTALDGMSFRVHGLDQLDGGGGRLWLVWFRLERHPEIGLTLPQAVDRILDRADDQRAVAEALSRAGYSPEMRNELSATRFSVVEERWVEVGPGFPRLVADDLVGGRTPAGVSDVHYTVDIASTPLPVIEPDAVLRQLLGV